MDSLPGVFREAIRKEESKQRKLSNVENVDGKFAIAYMYDRFGSIVIVQYFDGKIIKSHCTVAGVRKLITDAEGDYAF